MQIRNKYKHYMSISKMFRYMCRLRLKCDGTRAESRFRISAKRTSPFKSAGVSVQSNTGSRGVRMRGSNAGYTPFESFPFTSPPLSHRVPSHFHRTLRVTTTQAQNNWRSHESYLTSTKHKTRVLRNVAPTLLPTCGVNAAVRQAGRQATAHCPSPTGVTSITAYINYYTNYMH